MRLRVRGSTWSAAFRGLRAAFAPPSTFGVDVKAISGATLYILYGESRMKFTGWRQNDCIAQGCSTSAFTLATFTSCAPRPRPAGSAAALPRRNARRVWQARVRSVSAPPQFTSKTVTK